MIKFKTKISANCAISLSWVENVTGTTVLILTRNCARMFYRMENVEEMDVKMATTQMEYADSTTMVGAGLSGQGGVDFCT